MINVVVDTCVLAAAILAPKGSNMQALRRIIGRRDTFQIVCSSQMFAEYQDVLGRPLVTGRGLQDEAAALLGLVRMVGEEVVPKPVYSLVCPDRKDRPFLEASVYTDALLLTDNLKDFPFAGVTVLPPEAFIAWCDEQGL